MPHKHRRNTRRIQSHRLSQVSSRSERNDYDAQAVVGHWFAWCDDGQSKSGEFFLAQAHPVSRGSWIVTVRTDVLAGRASYRISSATRKAHITSKI